ncbi:hypothetical protein ABKV19_005768 [Rosa sericea]
MGGLIVGTNVFYWPRKVFLCLALLIEEDEWENELFFSFRRVSIVFTCRDSVADPAALKSNCLIVQLILLQRCILMLKTVATLRRDAAAQELMCAWSAGSL